MDTVNKLFNSWFWHLKEIFKMLNGSAFYFWIKTSKRADSEIFEKFGLYSCLKVEFLPQTFWIFMGSGLYVNEFSHVVCRPFAWQC